MAEPYLNGRRATGVASLLFLSTLMGYVARSSISVALPFISADYGWTPEEQGFWGGLLLGIFLVGYGFSNVLLSPLIDRYGPRRTLTAAIIIWSIITFFTGLLGLLLGAFIFLRLLLGLSQGVLFPSASKETKLRFPPGQRSKVNGLYMSSTFVSNILIGLLVLPAIRATDWQIVLYLIAFLGLVLAVFVWRHIKEQPQRKGHALRELYHSTWPDLRRSSERNGFWYLLLGYTIMNMAWWGLSLWLPTYLAESKGFTLDELVWSLPVIYLGGIGGILIGSWLSDRTGRRSLVTAIFCLGAALFLSILVISSDHSLIIISTFLGLFFLSLMPTNAFTLLQGIVPGKLIGTATGLLNGVSNGLGVVGTLLIGFSLTYLGSFDPGMAILAGIQVVAALAMLSFQRWERADGPEMQ